MKEEKKNNNTIEEIEESRMSRRQAIKATSLAATAFASGAVGTACNREPQDVPRGSGSQGSGSQGGPAQADPLAIARDKIRKIAEWSMKDPENARALVGGTREETAAALEEALGGEEPDDAQIDAVRNFDLEQLHAISLAFVGTTAVN